MRRVATTSGVVQVQSANQDFESQVRQIVQNASGSLADAGSRLTTASQQLADTYGQTFAKVDFS